MIGLKSPSVVSPRQLKQNTPGFRSVDLFHGELLLEPYLVFTEFHMDQAIFGPHPHAGMSVLTYMLPDSPGGFINRDSRGDHSSIEPGGAHITQAGSGILHDEVPERAGTDCHGMQIWINHSDANRLVEPRALHAASADIPEHISDAARTRVVLGQYQGITSPLVPVTDVLLLDIALEPGKEVTVPVQPTCFIYVLQGEALLSDGQKAPAQTIAVFHEEGELVRIQAGDSRVNFLLASGTPHHEPIVQGGPFVGTTQEHIHTMRRRFSQGEMGTLSPL